MPQNASVWYYPREIDYPHIKEMWDIANTMAKAAAMMTGTDTAGATVQAMTAFDWLLRPELVSQARYLTSTRQTPRPCVNANRRLRPDVSRISASHSVTAGPKPVSSTSHRRPPSTETNTPRSVPR